MCNVIDPMIAPNEVTQEPNRYAVIVLNWNGLVWLRKFLGNWLALTPDWADLVIVDNGSTDASVDFIKSEYPSVRCIEFSQNYGFAEGYNRAIALLEYEVVVLLNSDVALHNNWLDSSREILSNASHVVALQPKIRAFNNPNYFEYAGAAGGYIDILGYPYCAGRVFEVLEPDMGQYDEHRSLMWATGACLVIRRQAYLDAGGLDARFFAHQEEIDLCWRLRARGGEIVIAPESYVYHVGGGSLDAENPRKTYLNFRNNILMIYKNMPYWRMMITLIIRFVLDLIATLRFVQIGRKSQARAVLIAWRDALRAIPQFRDDRKQNLARQVVATKKILSPLSIVWQYYVLGRKKYSEFR